MRVEIVTPEKKVYTGEADSARFPGVNGDFQILDNHAAMISVLGTGDIRLRAGHVESNYTIEGGVVEVLRNQVTVLVEKVVS